jgi:hypothetical protein
MSDNREDWLISLVQSRYEWLSLTKEQAKQIYDYEINIEGILSKEYIPSSWEEKHIEQYFFKPILTPEQFSLYQIKNSEQEKDAESYLIEDDIKAKKDIEYLNEVLKYYESDLIPKIFYHKAKFKIGLMPEVRDRISFLKGEYIQYLKRRTKEICVAHVRYSKNFQPNKLKVELLRLELDRVYPNYYLFKRASDDVIKELGKSFITKMGGEIHLFKKLMSELKDSIESTEKIIYDKYYPNPPKLAAIIQIDSERSEAEMIEDDFLSYLLIDQIK